MHFQNDRASIHLLFAHFTVVLKCVFVIGISLYALRGSSQSYEVEESDVYSKPLGMVVPKEVKTTYFHYQLMDGVKLKLGSKTIEGREMQMHLSYHPSRFFEERNMENVGAEKGNILFLSFHWPYGFLKKADLSITSFGGKVLWSREVDEEQLDEWQEILWDDVEKSKRVRRGKHWKKVQSRWKGHSRSQYGIAGFDFDALGLQKKEAFRLCVTDSEADYKITFCSNLYTLEEVKGDNQIQPAPFEGKTAMVIDGVARKPLGRITVQKSKSIEIEVTFDDGATMKAVTAPRPIEIVDLDWNSKGVWVTVAKEKPVGGKVITVAKEEKHWLGPTIGKQENLWRVHLSQKRRYFSFSGYFGIPFQKKMVKGPPPKLRVFIDEQSPRSTYKEVTQLRVKAPRGVALTSKEKSVEKVNDEYYLWNYWAKVPGEAQRAHLAFQDIQNRKWLAHHTLFRGFSNEFSGRAILGLSESSTALAGELFFGSWFESLFGWESYFLSRQRWGIALRHFQGIAPFQTASQKFSIGHSNFDLKYRFSPGVWGYDESWGLILGGQNVTYLEPVGEINESVSMVGGGFFWARSMPQLFDSFFNLIPFLRYPKWVDLDFTYYALSMGKVVLQTNYLLNFHGKVFWTKHFFGEGGVTFKQIDFQNPENRSNISTFIIFGKFGIGINF